LESQPSSRTEGKPAVRNDRGDRGNVGIIRSPIRASILPDLSGSQRSKLSAFRDACLLDHLVGGGQQRFRDGKAERLGCCDVDDQINFGGLLHGEVGRLVAFENAPSIDARLVRQIAEAAAITHQAAGQGEFTDGEDRRERMAGRQCHELLPTQVEETTGADQDRTNALLRKSCERRFEVAFASKDRRNVSIAPTACEYLKRSKAVSSGEDARMRPVSVL
jgi:hypothetical protein